MNKIRISSNYINQKIEEDLELDEKSKESLKKYNKTIVELKNNKIKNYSTIISNCSSIYKNKYIEYIELIFNEYKLVEDIKEYRKYMDLDECNNCLLILKDINLIHINKLGDFLNTCYKMSTSVVLFAEEDISYYKYGCEDIAYEIDNLIEISNDRIEEKDYCKTLLSMYKENNIQYDVQEEKLQEIINKISDKTDYKGLDLINFVYEYSIKKMNKKERKITGNLFDNNETKIHTEIDFDKMVGLDNIKKEINDIKNYLEFKKKSKSNMSDLFLNMFLLGNPGTGKTMVAKMLGSIFYEFGLLESDEVILVTASQLTGEHVGETKNVTKEILRKAKGKLLCIDEAYGLKSKNYRNGNNPFNEEAIEVLLEYLSDPKNIVLFLGYKKEMKELYSANPGIKSRIYKEIEFEDYTTNELLLILSNHLKEQGLKIDKEAIPLIENYIEMSKKKSNFGNARFIKAKLAQELVMNHSRRKLEIENYTIEKEDVPSLKEESRFGLV